MENAFKILKQPKISLIITYHNLGKFINDCVSSILAQDYKNYEIIIVNDFSDEKNTEVLNKTTHEKIKIINLTENKGQLLAFYEGLKVSEGEFICMIDADDVLLPSYLKTLLCVHLNHNTAFVSCAGGEIDENNEITSLNYIDNPIKFKNDKVSKKEIENLFNKEESFNLEFLDIKKSPFGLWSWNASSSVMMRRKTLDILDYFPDKNYWKTGADKVIFSLLHLIGGSINVSSLSYFYRHHKNNSSGTTLITGNKKYLSEEYTNTIITWNKKLRMDTIKMFLQNKNKFIEEYNFVNYIKMLYRVVFCVNLNVFSKAINALIHKCVKFMR